MRLAGLFILLVAANIQAQIHEAVTPFFGMAGADDAFFSPWCLLSNPAGISQMSENYAGVSYRHLFDLKELSTKTVFAVHPVRKGVLGMSYVHFGYEKHNEQMIGVAWGKRLADFLDIGVKIDYLFSKTAKQSGIRQALFFETGLIFSLPYDILVGIYTYNPADIARLTAPEGLYVAENYSLGASWKIDEMFTLATQMNLTDSEVIFSAGIVFMYQNFLNVKCGFRTKYNNIYAGVGAAWKRYDVDINYNTHPNLGSSTGICLGVRF